MTVDTNLYFKRADCVFWIKFAQKGISGQKQDKKHQPWIQHNLSGLGNKFYLKHTILIFSTKSAEKGYFKFKTQKNEHHDRI